jgi:hypothetical protein
LYQADKIFADWFGLYSDFVELSTKKREVKGKCKYKRAAQEKIKKKKKSEVLASFVSSILRYVLLALTRWDYV